MVQRIIPNGQPDVDDTIHFVEEQFMLNEKQRIRPARPAPQRGVRLSEAAVTIESGSDLFNHAAFTLMIDFCREDDADAGYLVTFDGSFTLAIREAGIAATVVTSRGERTLRAEGLRLKTGRWHRLALTFSGEAGRAELFLDGAVVAAADDLAGARQAGNFFAELVLGDPKGRSFTGLADNFRFLGSALEPRQLVAA